MSGLLLLALLAGGEPAPSSKGALPEASVGMPLVLREVVLPGPQLEAVPWTDRRQKLVVRVLDVYPHGDAFRYDLECVGYEPGTYDLREHLRRPGEAGPPDLRPMAVRIVALLPPGQIEPHPLASQTTPRLGGYRWLLAALGVAWVVGLLAILRGRRRREALGAASAAVAPTLAERLRPLVERAQRGELTPAGQAEIERLLLADWRQRLRLDEEHPAAAIVALRAHPEAGALLRRLEAWLHDPQAPREIDLPALLAPFCAHAAEANPGAEGAGASR